MISPCRTLLGALALALLGSPLPAQSPERHVAAGDAALEQGKAAEALEHYEAAIAADSMHAAALWRAAQLEAELAEYDTVPSRRVRLEARAAEHARAAVRADSTSVDTRFALARVLGQLARTSSDPMVRAQLGKETWDAVQACLVLAPDHAGCLHVLGGWHATVSALGSFTRDMAEVLVGSDIFSRASWAEAERNLLAATRREPERIVHRLELGRAYAAQGKHAEARAELERAAAGRVADPNDARRKLEASRALERLAGR